MVKTVRILAPFLVALLPLLPLINSLTHPARSFYPGWEQSANMVTYYASHIEKRAELPLVLHLAEGVGFPHPLFEEPLMMPLLGLMAAKVGTNGAIFIWSFLLLVVAFLGIRKCLRPFRLGEWDNALAAALVWFFFPLTQFYAGRFAEAGAVTLLFAGLAFWDIFAREPNNPYAKAAAAVSWLCFTLMAGIYPGGFAYSFGTISLVVLSSFWISKNWILAFMGVIGVLFGVLLALGPWLYTTVHFAVWDKAPVPHDVYSFAVILLFFAALLFVQVRNVHTPEREGIIVSALLFAVALGALTVTLSRLPTMQEMKEVKRIDAEHYHFSNAYPSDPHPEWLNLPLVKAEFRSSDGTEFGRLRQVTLNLESPSLVQTNVVAFPWNQIRIEKHFLERDNTLAKKNRIYFALPKGVHRVEYILTTPTEWRVLKQLSTVGFAVGLFLLWFFSVRAILSGEKP